MVLGFLWGLYYHLFHLYLFLLQDLCTPFVLLDRLDLYDRLGHDHLYTHLCHPYHLYQVCQVVLLVLDIQVVPYILSDLLALVSLAHLEAPEDPEDLCNLQDLLRHEGLEGQEDP